MTITICCPRLFTEIISKSSSIEYNYTPETCKPIVELNNRIIKFCPFCGKEIEIKIKK